MRRLNHKKCQRPRSKIPIPSARMLSRRLERLEQVSEECACGRPCGGEVGKGAAPDMNGPQEALLVLVLATPFAASLVAAALRANARNLAASVATGAMLLSLIFVIALS